MTSSSHNPMDAIAALMDERSRYEAWLSTLETRRGATPNHVYDRVRTDYEARLRNVLEQLSGRAAELQERAEALRARVTELQRQEDAHRDERAEAELRALVGEHTADRWAAIRERADAEIARLSAQRQEVSSELERVRDILNVARTPRDNGATAAPAPSAGVPKALEHPPASRRPEAEPLVRAAERPADNIAAAASAFDELAFLKSVVDPRTGSAAPKAAPADGALTERDARPLHSEGGGRETPSSTPAVTPGTAGAPHRGRGETMRRPTLDSVPAFLKDVPAEQVKTLKCQECGTMNYPTEWYCERCGGELAAM
jgi:chaperonin cofactor prefoldin